MEIKKKNKVVRHRSPQISWQLAKGVSLMAVGTFHLQEHLLGASSRGVRESPEEGPGPGSGAPGDSKEVGCGHSFPRTSPSSVIFWGEQSLRVPFSFKSL